MNQQQDQDRLKNQKEFREILEKYGLTQKKAAELISKETDQKVGDRKVRTWLAGPEVPSSRGCPNWALTALKRVAKRLTPVNPDR